MKKIVSALVSAFLVCGFCALGEEAIDVRAKIQTIACQIADDIPAWKMTPRDLPKAESPDLDDAGWPSVRPRQTIREKTFWLRHTFKVPELFAGTRVEGTRLKVEFCFRGLGVYEAQIQLNGCVLSSFRLEFGNQSAELKHDVLLAEAAQPGDQMLLALRLDNLGRLPLKEQKEAEPGTYFQIREARLDYEGAREARELLGRLVLDLRVGAMLLDLERPPGQLSAAQRPIADAFKKARGSPTFQKMQQAFAAAVREFDLKTLTLGEFSRVEEELTKFYAAVRPVSRWAKTFRIFTAGNAHIDLAWLWRWPETVEVARATFSTIMDNMEEYPDIVYIQSQAQAYQWMEEFHPEVFARIRQKVKEGRWEIIGGMWAEPDCNLTDGESFIRQILYGKRYFLEKFGVDVKIGWNPDSFGYNWNMPQFFKKSGIEAFVTQKISWNDTTVFPYYLFVWEGADGSRILTYFPPTGYVGTLEAQSLVKGLKEFEQNTGKKDVFILYGLGDHGGGPNREMLDRVKGYRGQKIFPQIKHSSFADYIGLVRQQDPGALPVWTDELYLEYHRGTYTTQAETKKLNRKSEVLLSDAEKISALAHHFGIPYPQESLNRAWERVLMNQFHDILPGSSINPVYKDARESYMTAQASARRALDTGLRHLASKVDTTGGEGYPLLVLNTLAWQRDGLVRVRLPAALRGAVLVLDASGQEAPAQLFEVDAERELCFIARAVPSLGYRVYRITKGKSHPYTSSLGIRDTELENRFFRVRLDPESGNIISIFDKGENREVLAPSAQGNQIQLFEDIPAQWDAWNIGYTGRSWTLDKADSISVGSQGPVWASLVVKKSYLGLSKARREPTADFPSSFFTQEIILYDSLPTIEIAVKVDWWEDHVLCKVAFPVDVQSTWATYEIPFAAIERPTTRNTDWERARFEVPAIRWADLSDGSYGVSLLNESKYGYDTKDSVLRLTLLRSPLWPDPMADRGKHELAYALYPHHGDWREADTVRRGYEFNTPLHAVFTEPHPGDWPTTMSFFEADADNIVLAAVKKAEDRETLILRLYESEGRDTSTRLRLFFTPKKTVLCDLMENRKESLSFADGAIELRFKKWEVKTLEIVRD